ncbi:MULTISPECIES: glycoside hydrolase family 95 protein [Streptomyces]|nr:MULTISPECIES: glycoside hydrolase family 95 protein [Streptomyces]
MTDTHTARPGETLLTYARPAQAWTDALPLGNGTLGAMCFGGVDADRLQLNDHTCWSGSPASAEGNPLLAPGEGPRVVAAARAALDAGDVRAAEDALHRLQHGHSQSFQPLADLWLTHPEPLGEPTDYRRSLDLAEAVARHAYTAGGTTAGGTTAGGTRIAQETWISAPAGALVLRRTAGAGRLPATRIAFTSPHPTARATAGVAVGQLECLALMPSEVAPPHEADLPDPIRYAGGPGEVVSALAAARVITDGRTVADGDGLLVSDATTLTVLLSSETDHRGPLTAPHGDAELLRRALTERLDRLAERVLSGGLADLRAEHAAEHGALFDRAHLTLAAPAQAAPPAQPGPPVGLPTDERLRRHQEGEPDPGLAALAFHYGRYLLIASSRPGTLPANLQGLWNAQVRPPWSSNYTTNINAEMNYWPAEPTGLPECHTALLDWLTAVRPRGAAVARTLYGLNGWAMHHNSDAWGFSLPAGEGDADCCWSFWPLGAAWLASHVWDHYDYGRDLDFLARQGWPLVRDAGTFCLEWLVERPDGRLGTSPSTSPENKFVAPDGAGAAVSVSATADLALIRHLLERGLAILDALAERGVTDDGWRAAAAAALERLPAERVAPDGRLAEWSHDLPDAEPAHRHTSHLVGVYPHTRIDPERTPELAAAARRTLDARGPRSTGWSLAWRLALRARLRDAEGALTTVRSFLRPMADDASDEPSMSAPSGVYRNLFCAHPPFQIDGNFGFTAGIAEMLLWSEAERPGTTTVLLLPAVPDAWPEGSFTGLRARGGVTVDANWSAGRARWARLTAGADREVTLRWRGGTHVVRLAAGEPHEVICDG